MATYSSFFPRFYCPDKDSLPKVQNPELIACDSIEFQGLMNISNHRDFWEKILLNGSSTFINKIGGYLLPIISKSISIVSAAAKTKS